MFPYISVTLPSFTVFGFAGGIITLFFIYIRMYKNGYGFRRFLLLAVLGFIGAAVGAKLLFMISRLPWLFSDFSFPRLLRLIFQGGIVFYGGLFGVLIGAKVFALISKTDASSVYRIIVPAIPLFHGFGRIGCFLAGCCHGMALQNPVIIGPFHFTRIPVQLFESVFCFLLFPVLLVIEKKRSHCNTLRLYLISYAIFRLILEFFRGDSIRGVYLLSTSQWISLAIIAYFIIKWSVGNFRRKKGVKQL